MKKTSAGIALCGCLFACVQGRGAGSRRGTGGMKTKLQAAEIAAAQGIDTVILNGRKPERLYDFLAGRPAGTLFPGRAR